MEQGAAEAQLNHWNDRIRAMGGGDPASPEHSALAAASSEYQEAEHEVGKAEARLQRACATPQAHRPAFNWYPTERKPAPRL